MSLELMTTEQSSIAEASKGPGLAVWDIAFQSSGRDESMKQKLLPEIEKYFKDVATVATNIRVQ
jgi:hypothetical protein